MSTLFNIECNSRAVWNSVVYFLDNFLFLYTRVLVIQVEVFSIGIYAP